jgi:hypothetical protein
MKATIVCGVLACTVGCVIGGGGEDDQSDAEKLGLDLPSASNFSCDDLDGSESMCLDFNDDSSPGFEKEGGEWERVDGRYVGWGPELTAGTCTSSLMTHALVPDVEAQDLSFHAELASLVRVDKTITLRSVDEGNRLQVNFRAFDEDGNFGDLIVQEMRDCGKVPYTTDNEIPIPHQLGEKIDVDIDVIGAHVTIKVNDVTQFDRELPIAVRPGRVGIGVIENATTMFDDLVMVSHDP